VATHVEDYKHSRFVKMSIFCGGFSSLGTRWLSK